MTKWLLRYLMSLFPFYPFTVWIEEEEKKKESKCKQVESTDPTCESVHGEFLGPETSDSLNQHQSGRWRRASRDGRGRQRGPGKDTDTYNEFGQFSLSGHEVNMNAGVPLGTQQTLFPSRPPPPLLVDVDWHVSPRAQVTITARGGWSSMWKGTCASGRPTGSREERNVPRVLISVSDKEQPWIHFWHLVPGGSPTDRCRRSSDHVREPWLIDWGHKILGHHWLAHAGFLPGDLSSLRLDFISWCRPIDGRPHREGLSGAGPPRGARVGQTEALAKVEALMGINGWEMSPNMKDADWTGFMCPAKYWSNVCFVSTSRPVLLSLCYFLFHFFNILVHFIVVFCVDRTQTQFSFTCV